MSSDGYHRIWKQGDKKPDKLRYIFSFWAFSAKERWTTPLAVACSSAKPNNNCIITRETSQNLQNYDHVFTFWVYPTEVSDSQEINVRSKSDSSTRPKRSLSASEIPKDEVFFSFWVAKSGNQYSKVIFIY